MLRFDVRNRSGAGRKRADMDAPFICSTNWPRQHDREFLPGNLRYLIQFAEEIREYPYIGESLGLKWTAGVLYGARNLTTISHPHTNCLINIWLCGPAYKRKTIPESILGTLNRHDRFRKTKFHAEFSTLFSVPGHPLSPGIGMPRPMPRAAHIFP